MVKKKKRHVKKKKTRSAKPKRGRIKARKKTMKGKAKIKPRRKRPHKPKRIRLKLKLRGEETLKRKLYRQQERLWMKKLNTILSDSYIRQLLIDLAGENALEIVRNFDGKVTDEDLAKKLKLKISDVRATLNKLHNKSLVYYIRQKDSETGWYSYSWVLNRHKIEGWASSHIEQKHNFDSDGIDRYFCPGCKLDSLLVFEEATDCGFRCPKCSKGMEYLDQQKFDELINL